MAKSKKEKHINTVMREAEHRTQVCDAICQRAGRAEKELENALRLVASIDRSVTFFGSARLKPNNVHYKQAQRLAGHISKLGFAVITGGGPGIMEAANKGAYEAGGASLGLNIELPFEQHLNPYTTNDFDFHYFFTRKVAMAFAAEAYLYFPGGFGTLDELFEMLTLIQTKKVPKVPVVLVGKDFWQPLHAFIEKQLYKDHKAISKSDMKLYHITDDEDEIIRIVKKAPTLRGKNI